MVIRFYPGADGGPPTTVESPILDPPDRLGSERPLDPSRLQHFGYLLAEQRRFRLEQLGQLSTAEPPASDQLGEVTDALRTAAETALAEIDAALDRLRRGSYGRCLGCGQAVLAERLEILPAAALCMRCQHAAEARSR